VDEFWVCQHCRSLNRAGSGKCYSCRKKYGSRPKDGSPVVASAGAPAPPPARSTTGSRPAPLQATYFSRPVALATAAAPAGEIAQGFRGPFHIPNPVAAARRRVAWSLAMHQFVSVGWLGYLTAVLLALVLVMGALVVAAVMPVAANLLQHANTETAWAQLTTGQQTLLKILSIVFAVTGALALLCFSVFIGLTTHNATGLGADLPMLTPYRAGTSWASALWAQARIAVGLIVPPALIWEGYTIPGLLAAIVAVEIAQRHVEDPAGWLTRPSRHLTDLYNKLGIEGSISVPIASIWSACFRAANAIAIALSALPLLVLAALIASLIAGRSDMVGWQTTGLGAVQLTVVLLVCGLVGFAAASLGLLAFLTLGLVQRQRTRRMLVRVGRSRSWAAHPGESGHTPGSPAQPAGYGEYDDEDRIVERFPRSGAPTYESPDAGTPGFSGPHHLSGPGLGGPGPGFGGPGFGGPDQGGPDHGGPDQASLYSPSTTSSVPESGEPPAAPSE